MIKLTGLILAFFASVLIGQYKADQLKRRRETLIDYKNLILHIATEIEYFKEPLPAIFIKLQNYQKKPSQLFLRNCAAFYQSSNLTINSLWEKTVEETYSSFNLSKEDLDIMKRTGEFLGQSDFQGQKEHFKLLNSQLDLQINDAQEAEKTKGKMYSKMGISIGIVITIIFL